MSDVSTVICRAGSATMGVSTYSGFRSGLGQVLVPEPSCKCIGQSVPADLRNLAACEGLRCNKILSSSHLPIGKQTKGGGKFGTSKFSSKKATEGFRLPF